MVKKRKIGKDKFAFSYAEFDYLDTDLGISLPQLVLGIEVRESDFNAKNDDWSCRRYDLKKGWKWLKIAHQTAGLACHQRYMLGILLQPKSVEVLQNMHNLSDRWLDSNAGVFGLSMKEANEYSSDLKMLFEVDCNASWRDMEEAIYPIDCTTENLAKLTSTKLPEDLDELVNWKDGWERAVGCVNRWSLRILGKIRRLHSNRYRPIPLGGSGHAGKAGGNGEWVGMGEG
jgi:hypothetical protein